MEPIRRNIVEIGYTPNNYKLVYNFLNKAVYLQPTKMLVIDC